MRTEFGVERSSCSCNNCQSCCKVMPGYLIPSDLDRMIPKDVNPIEWAEKNLLASPGALVKRGEDYFRIPTLVPATKSDGSCIHFDNGICLIWESSPFGCAFFDCKQNLKFGTSLSSMGLYEIVKACQQPNNIYLVIWEHLNSKGLVSPSVIEKRKKLEAML